MTATDNPLFPQTERSGGYEIRLRGLLDPIWAKRLCVPELVHEANGSTLLSGVSADQAALHGLLQSVRDLGVFLISVTYIPVPTTE